MCYRIRPILNISLASQAVWAPSEVELYQWQCTIVKIWFPFHISMKLRGVYVASIFRYVDALSVHWFNMRIYTSSASTQHSFTRTSLREGYMAEIIVGLIKAMDFSKHKFIYAAYVYNNILTNYVVLFTLFTTLNRGGPDWIPCHVM
jgi:hypothetical protein